MMIRFFYIIIIVMGCIACFEPPTYSDIPNITFKGFEQTGTTVDEGENLVLVMDFTDGDGNLGLLNSSDTTRNLYITLHSQLFTISDTFSIPNIPTSGSVKDISGTIRFNMRSYYNVVCNPFNPNALDTCYFDIFVRDRSGNVSNDITTTKVVFNCE